MNARNITEFSHANGMGPLVERARDLKEHAHDLTDYSGNIREDQLIVIELLTEALRLAHEDHYDLGDDLSLDHEDLVPVSRDLERFLGSRKRRYRIEFSYEFVNANTGERAWQYYPTDSEYDRDKLYRGARSCMRFWTSGD